MINFLMQLKLFVLTTYSTMPLETTLEKKLFEKYTSISPIPQSFLSYSIEYKFCHFSLASDLRIMKAFTGCPRPKKGSLGDVLCKTKYTRIIMMNSAVNKK